MSNSENNKRIAKNTMLLYLRMFISMGVSLYTSRVILDALGVDNFGIYNVVGGVVGMMSFINGTLATSTQRFLNYEMGSGDKKRLREVFSTALIGHYFIALIVLILAETIGLWFLNNKLVIPPGSLIAAKWVYQLSVITTLISIVSVPYNASIIANEKMDIYAYISLLEVVFKLLIVYLLLILPGDRLITYSLLLLSVSIITRIIYQIYCKLNFDECNGKFLWDVDLFKKMTIFSGWMFSGVVAHMLSTQGVSILVNLFFGAALNATRGIALQVYAAINSFSTNILTAVKPQIIKSYSKGDESYLYNLVFSASKLSFFLLLMLALPVILEAESILSIWLKEIPEFTVIFVQLTLIEMLIMSLYGPIATVSQASGKIRNYQFITTISYSLIFISTYVLFKLGFSVYYTVIASVLISFLGLFARLSEMKFSLSFPVSNYIRYVLLPIFLVVLTSLIPPLLYIYYYDSTILRMFTTFIFTTVSVTISAIILGVSSGERHFIKEKIALFVNKYIK